MLTKTGSFLAAASLVTAGLLSSGEFKAEAGGRAREDRSVCREPDDRRPGSREEKHGPFESREEAMREKRSLERRGWHCRIVECHDEFWVYARRNRR